MKLINIIVEALMGANEYEPPRAGPQLVADFYTLEMLKHGEQHIESEREDLLQAELNIAEQALLPYLKTHLVDFASYSIVCELRHCMDSATPTPAALEQLRQSNDARFQASAQVWLDLYGSRSPDNPTAGSVADYHSESRGKGVPACFMLATIMGLAGIPDEAMRFFYRLLTNDQVHQYATEIPRPDRDTVLDNFYEPEIIIPTLRAGMELFTEGKWIVWAMAYGGEPWKLACQGVLELMQAQSLNDIIGRADHVFDLQHNNGGLLDKNTEYHGLWLPRMLDIKRDAQSPEEVAKFASPFIRKLCRMALRQRFGRSWNRSQLKSQAMSKDFRLIMNSEFANEARRRGLVINSRSPYSNAIAVDVYESQSIIGMDRLASLAFYNDRLELSYHPVGHSMTLDNFTLAKNRTYDYSVWDFEDKGFGEILNLITMYPSGRKQIAARRAQLDKTQPIS